MNRSSLEVHSLINKKGRKWLVIDYFKFHFVSFTNHTGAVWKCIQKKRCPAKVCTTNIEDNIVTFAYLNHHHTQQHICEKQAVNKSAKKKATDDLDNQFSSQGDLFDKIYGPTVYDVQPILNKSILNIKQEYEATSEADTQFSSNESDSENLSEVIFPYMIRKKNKAEVMPHTDMWIFQESLELIKQMKENPNYMVRYLLWHLIGPQNLKYMDFIGCTEPGKISLPEKVYMTIQLFVAENCSPNCQLSVKQFIKCIRDAFGNAASLEISNTNNSRIRKRKRENDNEFQNDFRNRNKMLKTFPESQCADRNYRY